MPFREKTRSKLKSQFLRSNSWNYGTETTKIHFEPEILSPYLRKPCAFAFVKSQKTKAACQTQGKRQSSARPVESAKLTNISFSSIVVYKNF